MKTIWKNNIKKFGKLSENLSCDTLIIGGGIAGLWCAYHLSKAGQKVCVLEANELGSGVTKGSSAILTFAQELLYDELICKHGESITKQYLTDTKNAIKEIRNIIEKEKISCGLTKTDFVLFSTKICGGKKLKKEYLSLKKLGENTEFIEEEGLPFKIRKALSVKDAYLIDPLLLLSGLVDSVIENGSKIFEHTMVKTQPDGKSIKIGDAVVSAKNFVVASHFPFINFPGFYCIKLYQDQNYTIVFKPRESQKDFAKGKTYECIDKNGYEYRRVRDSVLCLGPDIRTGKKPYKSKYKIVEKHLQKHFEGYSEVVRF